MGTTKAAAVTTTSPVTTFDNISSDDISTCNLNIIMKLFAAMILALLGSALAMPQSALSATGFQPGAYLVSSPVYLLGKQPSRRVIKHTDKISPSGEHITEDTETIYYDDEFLPFLPSK